MMQSFEEAGKAGKEFMDTGLKSFASMSKNAQAIAVEATEYSKKAFEDGVAAAQDLAAAKTVTELFEKQTAFAQVAFEGWVSQATKMNEIYVAAAKDITAPLGARVTKATEALRSFSL